MSYILDALRRADSERDRKQGGVPGLNAQPIPIQSSDRRSRRRTRPWIWVVAGVTLGLALPLAWHLLVGGDTPDDADTAANRPRAPIAGTVAVQPPPPSPSPIAIALAPAAPAVQVPASSIAAPETAASVATVAPPPKPEPRAPMVPKPATAPARKAPPSPIKAPPAQTETAAKAAPEVRIPTLAELPDEVRREVPPLTFGGSVYSEVAAQRMVILNGQLLHEGDALTPELTLLTIRPKSAVLRIKSAPFEFVY